MPKLLIDESPLVVLPSLVKAVGLERAIILQQIHYLCQSPKGGKVLDDGCKWTWHTYDEMVLEYFPFWSAKTLQYHILKLEKEGFLLSCQPRQTDWDTTKFYRVTDGWVDVQSPNTLDERGSNALDGQESDTLDPHLKDTKTTTKTTSSDPRTYLSGRSGIPRNLVPIETSSPESNQPAAEIFVGTVLAGVTKELGFTKFAVSSQRDWTNYATLAFENNFTAEQFLECMRLLRGQTWRTSAVKPATVFENLPELPKLRREGKQNGSTEKLPTLAEKLADDQANRQNLRKAPTTV